MAKISVITPIFKAEPFMEKCARSLFEQTLQDIEYLFVDDCSPDNSVEILKSVIAQYPDRQDNIRILRNETNRGVAYSRCLGYKAATGDFVCSIDSDDWVDVRMFERLYNEAIESKADIVWCDLYRHSGEEGEEGIYWKMEAEESVYGVLKALLLRTKWANLSTQIVSRKLVHNPAVVQPAWDYSEDFALSLQYYFYAEKVKHVPEAFLYYRYSNPNSLSKPRSREQIANVVASDVNSISLMIRLISPKPEYSSLVPLALKALFKQKNTLIRKWDDPFEACRRWKEIASEFTFKHALKSSLQWQHKAILFLLFTGVYPYIAKVFPGIKNRVIYEETI